MGFWHVLWMILMIMWLVYGGYVYDRGNRLSLGGTIIPWLCVLIIGLMSFGVISVSHVVVTR